jgi:hypothetical protein
VLVEFERCLTTELRDMNCVWFPAFHGRLLSAFDCLGQDPFPVKANKDTEVATMQFP